jgi:hypothetical protein
MRPSSGGFGRDIEFSHGRMRRAGNEMVSALSYFSSQAVTGRLRCLMVVPPALSTTSVTPLPE